MDWKRLWKTFKSPSSISLPDKMLAYLVLDLTIVNLVMFYLILKVSLVLVLGLDAFETAIVVLAMVFFVKPYMPK